MIELLSERQRLEAIAACDRILELAAQQQKAFENIARILDNAANGRDPNDGVQP